MATSDSQKQLFSLIRDYATEKSQGERRVLTLKKRIDDLRSEIESANAELESGKRAKETAEQELKGYEVELSMNEASIQTLETRIASVQDEISKVGSDVDALKNNEAALRDEFIHQMIEFKTKIRKFQESALLSLQQSCPRTSSDYNNIEGKDVHLAALEKEISVIVAQTAAEEQEFERQQNLRNQLHQELADSKSRLELTEAIMKDMRELQELTRQTSALEEKCASFSEELQRKCMCPSCHSDNSESLAELLQEMQQK